MEHLPIAVKGTQKSVYMCLCHSYLSSLFLFFFLKGKIIQGKENPWRL